MAESQIEEKQEDPANIRAVPEVIPPPRHPLATDKLFNKNESINLKNLRNHLEKEGRLHKKDALKIIKTAAQLFKEEPNLLRLRDPITVCGDVHGQFFDLLRLMETGGDPARTKYLFLGDYVDRGCFSTEVVLYLFAHKITYNRTFFMIRGNHECRHLTSFFNFKDECMYKYDEEFYEVVMESFDNLPLAATINHKFLCIHGGLSPDILTLKDIQELDRFREVPREGPFCDLLWADPYDEDNENQDDGGEYGGPQAKTTWFSYNETRQCSYIFGIDAVKQFLRRNNLTAIVRAHEAQVDGYKFCMINGKIPRVVTIFSAPNYCDVYKNKGACLQFTNDQLKIRQFGCSPHPYYLPNFMDVFSWSLPFMSEKVTEMLYQMLDFGAGDPDSSDSADDEKQESNDAIKRGSMLKEKVLAASKLIKMYGTIADNKDKIVKLKQLSPSEKLPPGLLRQGTEKINELVASDFSVIKSADLENEAMPTKDMKPAKPFSPSPRAGKEFRFAKKDNTPAQKAGQLKEGGFDVSVEKAEK